MTAQRGQYYQYKAIPEQFYFVLRVFSPTKIQLLNVDNSYSVYATQTQLNTQYILQDFLPENRISCITESSKSGAHGFALTTPFVYGSVSSHSAVAKHKAFAPTYLRGKAGGKHNTSHAGLINPLVLGGRLAITGRVVQASVNQG